MKNRREYRVLWELDGDKGVWETEDLESALSCFNDYISEGYKVSFQTIESKAYLKAPGIGEKVTVKPSKEVGRHARPEGHTGRGKANNVMERYGL